MPFNALGLRAEITDAVAKAGYDKPTPVQQKSIPVVLAGRDVLAGAQTGTGKTAAFTLPILQLLGKARGKNPRALVLTPTRELAAQIDDNVKKYSTNLDVRSTVIFGGVGINPQIKTLRSGVDLLVATPGRLLDHAGQKTLDLSDVEILVLDEADRMLDMGFIHDIRKVLRLLPRKRQNLLFSATYPKEIKEFSSNLLTNPEMIEVARRNTAAEKVTQLVHPVEKSKKRHLLAHIIKKGEWNQVLIFTRTKHGANRLSQQLDKGGITSAAIHGNKSQAARTRALADFKSGKIRTLVATDIAARGIDINALPYVVNYELPNMPEDYVHRIGRTGRAEKSGTAVSLVCPDENAYLKGIEKLIKRDIPQEEINDFPIVTAESAGAGRPRGGGGQNKPKSSQSRRRNSSSSNDQKKSEVKKAGFNRGEQSISKKTYKKAKSYRGNKS